MKRNSKLLRTLSVLAVIALVCLGLALHTGTGTPSAWGIYDIAAICPLGAAEAALASKTVVPPMLIALAIGIALVILFMLIVYRLPGVIASVALLLYTALFLVVVSVAKLNLSLPGIAGVILTLGMAVDANVITFEQIKEQIRSGKTIRAAIDTGYKNAMSAIIDSNVTTIIAAVVLWRLGTGSTVGFAKTLFIGVVLSMIVMLFASQIMMKALVGVKAVNPALYGVKK